MWYFLFLLLGIIIAPSFCGRLSISLNLFQGVAVNFGSYIVEAMNAVEIYTRHFVQLSVLKRMPLKFSDVEWIVHQKY